VQRVHAEVAHAAVGAVELGLALPVDRLVRVEVARVQEAAADLEDAARAALRHPAGDGLAAREEGHLRRAAHEQLGMAGDRRHDPLVGIDVDPERLLAEQVPARLEDRHVQLGVQVVWHSAVDGLDVGVVEQISPVGREPRGRLEPLVPREHVRVRIAHVHDLRSHVEVGEVQPARGGRRELAAHQAAADDPEANDFHARAFIRPAP
jgi:hypothetical protein